MTFLCKVLEFVKILAVVNTFLILLLRYSLLKQHVQTDCAIKFVARLSNGYILNCPNREHPRHGDADIKRLGFLLNFDERLPLITASTDACVTDRCCLRVLQYFRIKHMMPPRSVCLVS